MKFQIATCHNGTAIYWTDETSSNRYGIGTVSLGNNKGELIGNDYGPTGVVPDSDFAGYLGRTAAQIAYDCVLMAQHFAGGGKSQIGAEQIRRLARFCSQCPTGPQISGDLTD